MRTAPISVAVPWSLSHYIPLNGFHPLYRALIDHAPQDVQLHAWDNVKLYEAFDGDDTLRDALLDTVDRDCAASDSRPDAAIARVYDAHIGPVNRVLTQALAGEIELQHTAPFPSLRRPFVFHCESFAPIFIPFAGQGNSEGFTQNAELREHYRRILAHPFCLGIFSHIPETLENLSRFFSDAEIDRRLHASPVGLAAKMRPGRAAPAQPPFSQPRFVFTNSAHQDVRNFFLRGGHHVLRFWQAYRAAGRDGTLWLRCTKPNDAALQAHGVDLAFLAAESGRSVHWIEDYLSYHELQALLASAHFFLLPSLSLHSVSIMQAMTAGAVPVVTDTIGTSAYVTDEETGIVLRGVRDALVQADPATGVLVESYSAAPALSARLESQLVERIFALLDAPLAYQALSARCRAHASRAFSGEAFSDRFWSAVTQLYARSERPQASAPVVQACPVAAALADRTLSGDRWAAVFESTTRPMRRIYTGHSSVFEYAGAFVHVFGNPRMAMNDWSPLAQYYDLDAQPLTFAETLPALRGKYLSCGEAAQADVGRHWLVTRVSAFLAPHPALHSTAASLLRLLRRARRSNAAPASAPTADQNIELMRQGVHGFNVVRYAGRYYAIRQSEGAFEPQRIRAGGYSPCFTGNGVDEVLRQLRAEVVRRRARATQKREPKTELVVEGLHGFNIVHVDATFYAILQRDGAFKIDKAMSNGYRCLFSGGSVAEVRQMVLAFVALNPPKRKGWLRRYARQTLNSFVDI